ncbi:unnamed protein product [Diamesa tonsa]
MFKVIFLVFSFINLSFCIHGSVEIDELSFDRVVSKFKTAIVKFDTQFPYGIDHEEWTNFVSQINNKSISDTDMDNILTAVVGIKDFGEFDNKQLGERYGVKDVFPSIKMFINGDLTKAIDFPVFKDKITADQLFAFTKENANVYVNIPGCIKELDELTDTFMTDTRRQPEIFKKSEQLIQNIKCEKKKQLAKTYAVLMKGIMATGDKFVTAQKTRMEKLLKDKLSDKKISELTKKLNIISSFKIKDEINDEL